MKNVLLLTDFSESSEHAIHYACSFFLNKETNYFLLHINKKEGLALSKLMSSESVYDSLLGNYKEKIKALKNDLENKYNTTFKASVRHNSFIEAVVHYIAEYKIDIVVAGFDGSNSLQEKVFGSNTIQLIRSISIDTLIVPQKAIIKIPENILCLLDEKDDLKSVIQNNSIINSTIKIVRVTNAEDFEIVNRDTTILNKFKNLKYTYKLISNIPLHYVKSYILQTEKIDLSILLIQKTSLIERFFEGNTTSKINKALIKPMLITH